MLKSPHLVITTNASQLAQGTVSSRNVLDFLTGVVGASTGLLLSLRGILAPFSQGPSCWCTWDLQRWDSVSCKLGYGHLHLGVQVVSCCDTGWFLQVGVLLAPSWG